jgi:hypothetical protein
MKSAAPPIWKNSTTVRQRKGPIAVMRVAFRSDLSAALGRIDVHDLLAMALLDAFDLMICED